MDSKNFKLHNTKMFPVEEYKTCVSPGVFEEKYPFPPDTYIDINGVVELKSHGFDGASLYVGANKTLTETINLFLAVSQEQPASFGYLEALARHMTKVAHIPVRNVSCNNHMTPSRVESTLSDTTVYFILLLAVTSATWRL